MKQNTFVCFVHNFIQPYEEPSLVMALDGCEQRGRTGAKRTWK